MCKLKAKVIYRSLEPVLGVKTPRAGRAIFWNATTDGTHTAARGS